MLSYTHWNNSFHFTLVFLMLDFFQIDLKLVFFFFHFSQQNDAMSVKVTEVLHNTNKNLTRIFQLWFSWNSLTFFLGSTGSSPKKHSFGKSTPPPKPKPPSFANNKGSTGSLDHTEHATNATIKEEPATVKELKINKTNNKTSTAAAAEQRPENSELDLVLRSDKKLAHPTAERVKAPKRRPPSSSFQKEAVSCCFFRIFVNLMYWIACFWLSFFVLHWFSTHYQTIKHSSKELKKYILLVFDEGLKILNLQCFCFHLRYLLAFWNSIKWLFFH